MTNGTWRDVVEIIGPRATVLDLIGIDGLTIDDHGHQELDDDQLRVSGYATEDAANEVRAAGCTVNLVISGPDLQELAQEDASTRVDEDPDGDV